MNTKADILSRKNQVDMKNDNKDVQVLKKELWTRRTTAEVMMLKRNQTTDNLDRLKEIQRNNMKEYKVEQELKKEDGLAWKQDGITYLDGRIYIPNNRKIKKQIL